MSLSNLLSVTLNHDCQISLALTALNYTCFDCDLVGRDPPDRHASISMI